MLPTGLPPLDQISAFLSEVALFKRVRGDFLTQIAERLEPRVYNPGEVIFEEGAVGDALYIIRAGTVGVFLVDRALGLEFELAKLRGGQVFGEMAVVGEDRRSATCKALEPTSCFLLTRDTFHRIVERIPQVALAVAQVLAQRVNLLNRERGKNMIDASKIQIDPEIYRLVPRHILEAHKMIPMHVKDGVLTVACADADDLGGLDEIRRVIRGVEIRALTLADGDYRAVLDRFANELAPQQRAGSTIKPKVKNIEWVTDDSNVRDGTDTTRREEIKELVDRLIAEAIEREASDIHVEPERDGVTVRYRVAGKLQKRGGTPVPRRMHRPIASRIKVLAELDINERRLPQDGRMSLIADGRPLDIRVSTLPTDEGEKIVMRVLDSANAMQPLEQIILADKICRVVRQLVARPHGVVYVCGPTGSGKTTTLYSALGTRRREDTNITTVEDPVEYKLAGITQVGVRPEIGLTFASVLRSVLRQDPNVILVGETRDAETGKLVLEAGLTGHMVLTSLHTNSALGSIQRLREMGLESFAIAASMVGVISQRLVRRNCPACATESPLSAHVQDQLVIAGILPREFSGPIKRSKGCATCSGTGFRGRVGAYEILVADDKLRERIAREASVEELRKSALEGAYVPMTRYSNYLLTAGIAAPEELIAIHSGTV
ncbi:MAG: Flp pilus assembly complex ATPase component TadA [Deltaproteobacteria bacterium]|nr:Flp pilus assembly complex ATPase component TadA [Deltaproteobacteria bacterium]